MSTWAVPGYSESLELGSGASGRVVLAVHEPTGLPVAVKYLSESLRTRPGFVHGFRAEAELLGGLESPYVAGFYEYVEAPEGAAIVMELVDGVSLRTLLTRQSPLSPESALVVLKGSLLGLADAHRAGVVHRDYKPENVLVTPEGVSKLVDFGIAVDAGIRAGVAGTPAYMAPEQWTGAPASPAGDVYAATATFFECLTGRKPYSGENLAQLALQHVEGTVPDEQVPEAVRALVRRGLAKTAAERPVDAAAFVADLERAAVAEYGEAWEERGRGRLAALVALLLFLIPSAPGTASGTTTDTARTVLHRAPGAGRLHPWRPTWPGVAVATAAVLVALLLGQGIGQGAGAASGQPTQVVATTSSSPVSEASALPSASASPSPSTATVSPSPSVSASAGSTSPSATTTAPASPTVTSTAPGTPTGSPTPPASPSTSPSTSPPPLAPAVKDVTVSGFRQTGVTTATTTITVTTDGTGPLTVTVGWSTGNAAGQSGTADGAPVSFRRSGATQYTLTVDHTFQGDGCYWTVRATTTPASADGGASQQLLTRRCDIR